MRHSGFTYASLERCTHRWLHIPQPIHTNLLRNRESHLRLSHLLSDENAGRSPHCTAIHEMIHLLFEKAATSSPAITSFHVPRSSWYKSTALVPPDILQHWANARLPFLTKKGGLFSLTMHHPSACDFCWFLFRLSKAHSIHFPDKLWGIRFMWNGYE